MGGVTRRPGAGPPRAERQVACDLELNPGEPTHFVHEPAELGAEPRLRRDRHAVGELAGERGRRNRSRERRARSDVRCAAAGMRDPRFEEYWKTEATKAVLPYVVGLAYADDETDGPSVTFGGSGTCLRVGDAYFVVTAAHVVRAATLVERIMVISTERPKNTSPRRKDIIEVGGVGKVGEDLDLALLEYDEKAAQTLMRQFVNLDELAPSEPRPGDLGMLLGAPGATRDVRPESITLHLQPWIAEFVAPPTPDCAASIWLQYADEGSVEGSVLPIPAPPGMSGAGMWSVERAEGPIALPPRPRLCGVLIEHWKSANVLRGLPITLLLRVLREKRSALRPAIDEWLSRWSAG